MGPGLKPLFDTALQLFGKAMWGAPAQFCGRSVLTPQPAAGCNLLSAIYVMVMHIPTCNPSDCVGMAGVNLGYAQIPLEPQIQVLQKGQWHGMPH